MATKARVSRQDGAQAAQVAAGERFRFGANWQSFLRKVDESRILAAVESLRGILGEYEIAGRSFLDIGSGSGLFSLAAHRLGARVHSFDFDPQSVACTAEMRRRFGQGQPGWHVEAGSVLDSEYMASLGHYDVVYSWGVLHHTGAMWPAIENAAARVGAGGRIWLALYNDQGLESRLWRTIKRLYNRQAWTRPLLLAGGGLYLIVAPGLVDLIAGRGMFPRLRNYRESQRGMDPWRDLVDWVGGYPFEVARGDRVFEWFRRRGFQLEVMRLRRMGCNDYLFSLPPPVAGAGAAQ